MSVADKLSRLATARNNIITKLKAKGVSSATNHGFEDFADDIDSISVGTDTSDATLNSAGQMLSGVTAYSKGTKYTGTIATKTASNLTASGKTVTVPAGYYASQATKDVAAGSATTPATTITKNPTISVNTTTGVITASVSGTQSVTPTVSAGYVSSGTAGTITVSGSNTSRLTLYDGSVTVEGGGVSLISFTIEGTSYQAEEGMTWQSWINSEYNTPSFYISGGSIYDPERSTSYRLCYDYFGNVVPPSSEINPAYQYIFDNSPS